MNKVNNNLPVKGACKNGAMDTMTVQAFNLLEQVLPGSKTSTSLCSLVSWGSHLLTPLMSTCMPTQAHSVGIAQNKQVKREQRIQK